MAIEYPVKIKFNYDNSELKKVKDSVGVGAAAKGEGKKGTNILGSMLGKLGLIAAVLTFLKGLLEPILNILQILLFVGIFALVKFIKQIWESISAFAAWAWDTVIKPIWEWLKKVGLWLWNNIIKPGWEVLKEVGLWIWNNIIIPGWEILKTIGSWIWNNILVPAFEVLLDVGLWIWQNIIIPGWNILKKVGLWLWHNIILPAWKFLKDVGLWIWEKIIKPAFDFLKNVGVWIWEKIEAGLSVLFNIGKMIFDFIKSLLRPRGRGSGSRQFGGSIAKTGMYLLHSGEQVSRGNTTNVTKAPNITVNVMGNANSGVVEEVVTQISRQLNSYTKW